MGRRGSIASKPFVAVGPLYHTKGLPAQISSSPQWVKVSTGGPQRFASMLEQIGIQRYRSR
jgi:hypothetical protein